MIAAMIGPIKRLLFFIGIALAVAAFFATGAEIAAYVMDPDLGLLPSAAHVWRTLSPATFEAALAQWPAFTLSLLRLPGWLVLGAPGLALIITCRTGDDPSPEHEQSLFLFDELAKRAREEGYDTPGETADSTALDFVPADQRYARDDVADDLIGDHDFLLEGQNRETRHDAGQAAHRPAVAPGKTPS